MVLQKFQMCDPSHEKQFEYCCIKDNKVFCSKCWFKLEHYRLCQSSRCGNYQKLAHLVINRALQLKNIYYLSNMSSGHETFQTNRIKSLQLNYQITELLRQWVEQKVPLFLWSMMNQMYHSRFSQFSGLNCNKYDSMCSQMLKTIKNPQDSKKPQYLETIIANFMTINHQIDGTMNCLKTQQQWKGKKDDKINQVLQYCRRHLGLLLVNTKHQMKDSIQGEITKMLSGFDNTIKFRGVSFPKVTPNETLTLFKRKECYRNISINTQLFSKLKQQLQQDQIYNGFNLSVLQLEQNPEQLLQLGKSFIKQKIFNLYSSVQTFKSSYPYKCAYVISTCLSSDEEYQTMILEMQKTYIKSIQAKSQFPFLNSLSIVIMGPQTIIIKFINRPEFCYTMKIYNYKKQRQNYYKKVRDILDLTQLKQKTQNQNDKHIPYTQNPSLLQLAYANFNVAFEEIFLPENNEQKIFEGETIAANRGMQLITYVIDKWKSKAKIELEFQMPQEEILQLIV